MSTPDISEYIAQSKANATATITQIKRLASGNQHHIAAMASANTSWTVGAQCNFATAFIYGTCEITNASYQNYNMQFSGTMWGLGLGGGTSYGALTSTLPPDQLNKLNCSFQVTAAAAAITVQIWDDAHGYVANFTGGALAVYVGITGGSGSWTATQ